ncbi:MAG: hypothetical protein QM681_23195 [Novosphingobium sp.]
MVIAADGSVDAAATELRAAMYAERPEAPCSYGPSIAALREGCLAETGLPAPSKPSGRPISRSLPNKD